MAIKTLATFTLGLLAATVLPDSNASTPTEKHNAAPAIQNTIMGPGSHLQYAYADGSQYDLQLRRDGTLRWEALEGTSKGQSAVEDNYKFISLRDGIGMVTWLESSGYSIAVVVDVPQHKVSGVVTHEKQQYVLQGTLLKLDSLP